jgi:hypothetical protein
MMSSALHDVEMATAPHAQLTFTANHNKVAEGPRGTGRAENIYRSAHACKEPWAIPTAIEHTHRSDEKHLGSCAVRCTGDNIIVKSNLQQTRSCH